MGYLTDNHRSNHPTFLSQDNFEEAELALKEAGKLAPQDKAVRAAIQELHQKRAEYVEKEKRLAKAMGGFLLKPAATGVTAAASAADEGKGKGQEVQGDDDEAVAAEEEEADSEEEEEQQQQQEPQATAVAPAQEQEQGQQQQQLVEPEAAAVAAPGIHPWLAWYMDHYDWFIVAAFVVLPLCLLWPDLVASWRGKGGAAGPGSAGGGGEF